MLAVSGSQAAAAEAERNRVQAEVEDRFHGAVGLGLGLIPDGTGGGLFTAQALVGCEAPAGWSLSFGMPASWSLSPDSPAGTVWGALSWGAGYRFSVPAGWRIAAAVSSPWVADPEAPWVAELTAAAQAASDPVVTGWSVSVGLPWPGSFRTGTLPPWFGRGGFSFREVLNDRATTGFSAEAQVVPDGWSLRWGLALRWSLSWADTGWSAASAAACGALGGWSVSGTAFREF